MNYSISRRRRTAGALAMLIACISAAAATAQPADKPQAAAGAGQAAPSAGQAATQLKAAGKDAALTVLPVRLLGRPSKQVGEVLAMMLERGGMQNLELGGTNFDPPEKADLAQTAEALAAFVRANPPETEYALFAEFLGTPATGAEEVRGVIVNKAGHVVWQDRQTGEDADFKRIKPGEPMLCCLLVVERLRPVLGLDDPTRADAPSGKVARRWREKTGLSSDAEQAAMKERQQAFKQSAAKSTVLVYPVRAGDEFNQESAAHLAELINTGKLMKAVAADQGPPIAAKGDMNEQKVLWQMARGLREHVQKQPPAEAVQYVLFADYLMGKEAAGAVHFAVCDRQGQLVIVDFQNGHHADFQAIKPKTRADCDRLVVKRLEGYCR